MHDIVENKTNKNQTNENYSRIQVGLDPLQLAVLPDRTQFMVAVSPVSRYPGEQEKVQWDPAALLELLQEMLPCAGADRDGEQLWTGKREIIPIIMCFCLVSAFSLYVKC